MRPSPWPPIREPDITLAHSRTVGPDLRRHGGRGHAWHRGAGGRQECGVPDRGKDRHRTGIQRRARTRSTTKKTVAERLRDHSWFIAYAPAEQPRIARGRHRRERRLGCQPRQRLSHARCWMPTCWRRRQAEASRARESGLAGTQASGARGTRSAPPQRPNQLRRPADRHDLRRSHHRLTHAAHADGRGARPVRPEARRPPDHRTGPGSRLRVDHSV